MRLAFAVAALLVLAAPAAAQNATIYSSLPLSGAQAPQSRAIVAGERLALEQAGGAAGGRRIRLVSLNDATEQAGFWTPEKVSQNARRAAQDDTTIGYIGEFNSGGSAVAIPILNEAGVPQISPSNTAIGLTRGGPGADRGEPDKYYPTGKRTYARIVPNDRVQAAALVRMLKELRVKRAFVVEDGEVYGRGVATLVRRGLARRGIELAGRARLARSGRNVRRIARRMRAARAGALVFGGITVNGAPKLFDAVHRRNRRAQLLGSDGVAESAFVRKLSRGTRRRTRITVATLAPSAYPAAAQPVLAELRKRNGGRRPSPYALYGYEAMSLLLDAIGRAGDPGADPIEARAPVRRQLFATRDRDSVLGRYSIDKNGDTTLKTYGVYRPAAGGRLRFDRAVDAGAP